MSLKEKYNELAEKIRQQKEAYETKRKAWAENKTLKLEQQAKKDEELLKLYERQERAMKKSQKLKQFQTKKKSSSKAYTGGTSLFGDTSSILPFDNGKKKRKKESEFDFLPRI